ncbi:hypothetical protein Pint_30460 [Pistacia integerrima]|uniref:Uncharacterized protein n=1 Tax=Pistacia integerrima TaxID=434235 RepID=A0ACC0X1U2_9ROSI|nr:hypothetical protein Pint_30460 [Pistacia integerrima]
MKFVDSFDLGYDRIELLLEFFDGKPLDQSCITDKQILSKIAKQILRGLSYLHKRRIAHKGIKPLSLFMDSRHKMKITGFVASNIEGSVAYMSPDYLSGNGDLWGFGITMLAIYMGKLPHSLKERDWASLMLAILKSPPPEASLAASGEFRDFIGCCLQKEATRRLTAEQLLEHPFILRSETNDDDQACSHTRDLCLSIEPTQLFKNFIKVLIFYKFYNFNQI